MAEEPMENLALFKLTEEETANVIKEAGGGTVTWARRDGHPTGAYVQVVVVDGQIFTTSTDDRGKTVSLIIPIGPGDSVSWVPAALSRSAAALMKASASAVRPCASAAQPLAILRSISTWRAQ